jgi:hypothetical protein
VLANLLAMPIVPAWVMLAGFLALLALPFGFDAPLWKLMGVGIQWMIAVAPVGHAAAGIGRTGRRVRGRSAAARERWLARRLPAALAFALCRRHAGGDLGVCATRTSG